MRHSQKGRFLPSVLYVVCLGCVRVHVSVCHCYMCVCVLCDCTVHCVCACVFKCMKYVCSSPQAAPSTLGCRSTHSSPVHSASSRLSQGFSVSVPTLLFAGMKPRHRSSEAPRARQCRQVPHDPHDPVTTLPRTCHPVLHWQTAMTSPAPLPFSCQSNLVYSLKMPLTNQ